MRAAILEDDSIQSKMIQAWLASIEIHSDTFETGELLLSMVDNTTFDLFIIDWELPGISGIEVVKTLRQDNNYSTPILFTTNHDQEHDIVLGLTVGADDYMTKPLREQEFLARISALLRRHQANSDINQELPTEPYKFDRGNLSVTNENERIQLTAREFELAMYLFNNTGCLLSRGQILKQVWGKRPDLNTRTVDTHISLVRQKLKINPANGWRLNTIYGHGYRLEKLISKA